MKSNQSEEIKRNIVFNYQENYDSSYFTTYKPEKVILTVIAKSSNKVGYTKRTEKIKNITQVLIDRKF